MAATDAGRALTEGHRIAQARLGSQTVNLLRSTWPLLDPSNLDGSVGRWLRVSTPLVQRQGRRSALLSAQYLRAFRAVELGLSDWVPVLVEVEAAAVATSLTVTGPVDIKQSMRRGLPLALALTTAEAGSAAAGMRHALNAGRNTVIGSVRADRQALGWARVVGADPCGFCAMLASRGPVYADDTAGFEAHDSCGCGVEPVYSDDAQWPPRSQEFAELWQETTRGYSGRDAINAFRRAVET